MSLIKQHLYNQALLEELRQDYFFMLNDIADEQERVMMELMEEPSDQPTINTNTTTTWTQQYTTMMMSLMSSSFSFQFLLLN